MDKRFQGKTCPYCKSPFEEGDVIVTCSVCEMPHHLSCWQENNGCTTFGCTGVIKDTYGHPASIEHASTSSVLTAPPQTVSPSPAVLSRPQNANAAQSAPITAGSPTVSVQPAQPRQAPLQGVPVGPAAVRPVTQHQSAPTQTSNARPYAAGNPSVTPAQPMTQAPSRPVPEVKVAAPAPRFEVLFESDPMVVQENLPVLIEKLALLKDIPNDTLSARFSFRSLADKPIIALLLDVSCSDIWGNKLKDIKDYQALDLKTEKGEAFGEDIAVPVPDATTRWIDVTVRKIVYADRTIAEGGSNQFELPKQIALEEHFKSKELAEEYIRETTPQAKYAPINGQSHWRCTCGEINPKSETFCSKCGALLSQITSALDCEALKRSIDLRKEEERIKAERAAEEKRRKEEERRIRAEKERREREERERIAEERRRAFEEEEERRRRIAEEELKKRKEKDRIKRRKILFGILGAVFVLFLVYAAIWHVIPYIKYVHAGDLKANKQYDEAYEAYVALGDYRDSAEMALNTKYAEAKDLMDSGGYFQAAAIFDWLGDYWNSKTCADYCRNKADYIFAITLYESGRYSESISIFQRLADIGFEDSFEYYRKSLYGYAFQLLDEGLYDDAMTRFQSLGAYGDSEEMVRECKYQKGVMLYNDGQYRLAFETLESVSAYYAYKDAGDIASESRYRYGIDQFENGNIEEAYTILKTMVGYKDVPDIWQDVRYEYAVYLADHKKWSDAYPLFDGLGSYKDSKDRYKASYYEYGLTQLNGHNYYTAVTVFSSLGSYKESQSNMNEAKYLYVKANKNNTDQRTYQYLKDLKAIWYKDSNDIYKELYAWGIKLKAFNYTEGNSTTILTSVSKNAPYLHYVFEVTGGPPGETVSIMAYTIWPNGTISYVSPGDRSFWQNARRGSSFDVYYTSHDTPGTMTVRVYNVNTAETLGEFSIRVT